MVLQLSLVSSIDDASYDLFVSTLSNLCGNPPVVFGNFTAMLKPNPAFDIEQVNSKNQLVEQSRIKLCRGLPLQEVEADNAKRDFRLLKKYQNDEVQGLDLQIIQDMLHGSRDLDEMEVDSGSNKGGSGAQDVWSLSISDIPTAGSGRKVSTQAITETTVLASGGSSPSIVSFLSELGYVLDFQFLVLGIKFNMNNGVFLELSKIWRLNDGRTEQITKGGFLVKAFVNVAKSTDIKSINSGTTSLLALQKELSGYVELEIPDRKSMDSRLENKNDI